MGPRGRRIQELRWSHTDLNFPIFFLFRQMPEYNFIRCRAATLASTTSRDRCYPLPDEPGLGETRDGEGFFPEQPELSRQGPGMDVDIIENKPETDLKELFSVLMRDARDEVSEANREIMSIVKSLGGNTGKYRRERQRALKAVVSEVYSPPRVTAATERLPEPRLIPGFA